MSVDGPSKSAHYGANLGTGSMADSFSQPERVPEFVSSSSSDIASHPATVECKNLEGRTRYGARQ